MKHSLVKVIWLLVVGLLLLMPNPSFSEFYKYRDQSGAIRFTDDLTKIPVDQRPKVQNYSEPEDFLPPAQRRQNTKTEGKRSGSSEESLRESPEQWAARLKERKGVLEEEYEKIVQAQEALSSERSTLNTPASYLDYNKKRARLQDRAKVYEKERKRFEEEVKTYNEWIGSRQPIE